MRGRLERLLRPKTIAVIGGREAAKVIAQCDRLGFAGEIWAVNPRRESLGGRPCYASVAELPAAPDAAFVGVRRETTVEVVAALAARRAGGGVCYASGFRETAAENDQGVDLQAALLEAAGDLPIIGPNCYGLINYLEGALLWPDEQGGRRLEPDAKGVAIVTQSSNIAISMTMQRRGLPLAYVVTAGNQAQTGLSEIAAGLLEDSRVTALGLHIEGFDDIGAFQAMAAKARRLGKPVVALKVGRYEPARAAAVTHTASLAGSDAGADALFRRLGIGRVETIPAFLEALKLLHLHGPLAGFKIASLSCSGGEAAIMADAVLDTRLRFQALAPPQVARLKAALGPRVTVANPLDYHTYIWGDEPAMTETFSAMAAAGADLNLLVLDLPRGDCCDESGWMPTLRAFESALAVEGGKGAVVATLPENLPEASARDLLSRGIAPLSGIAEALAAVEAAAGIGAAWSRREAPALLRASGGRCAGVTPDEATAKVRLAAAGVAVPSGKAVETVEDAVSAAEALGYPIALKALGLAHKTEVEGLRLGLRSAEAVGSAAEALLALGAGLLVERMVEGVVAELILGLQRDPQLGLVLTLGAGGVLAELLQDTRSLLLPASETEVRSAIAELKIARLLQGYRGRPAGDLEALISMVMALQRFAEAEALEELDLNPVIVCEAGQGAFAADALLRIREENQ